MEKIPQHDEQAPPLGDDDYHRDSTATPDSKPRRARRRSRRAEPGKASSMDASPIPGLVTPESVMELHRTLSKLPVVKSGFHALDEILDGLRPTQPYVLAAATGQGKTSFVLQLITQYQGPVLIWTREMEPWQLQGRMVSQLSDRDSNGILRGEMDDSEYEHHMEPFKHRLWYYRDASLEGFERAVEHVVHKARDRDLDGPLLVVLDYLQKLAGSTDRLREAVSEASEALRRATQQHRRAPPIIAEIRGYGTRLWHYLGFDANRLLDAALANHPESKKQIEASPYLEIGLCFFHARINRKMSQSKAASLAGCSVEEYRLIEQGEKLPTLITFARLFDALPFDWRRAVRALVRVSGDMSAGLI